MLFIVIFLLIGLFISIGFRKKQNITDLFLLNIECLATPENPNVECTGIGSLDCPIQYFHKVKYIW